MKLLPRLYAPNSGRVLIDGYDIDKIELYSLRRQIGIVLQDPLLFSGTVAENIALLIQTLKVKTSFEQLGLLAPTISLWSYHLGTAHRWENAAVLSAVVNANV